MQAEMHVPDMGVNGSVRGYTRGMDECMLSRVSRRACLQLRSGSVLLDIQTIPILACIPGTMLSTPLACMPADALTSGMVAPIIVIPLTLPNSTGVNFETKRSSFRTLHYLGFRTEGKKITTTLSKR